MSITIVANDVREARMKLAMHSESFAIRIKWRENDYGRKVLKGCVIDVQGERVPLEFESAAKALAYLKNYLTTHDLLVSKPEKPKK